MPDFELVRDDDPRRAVLEQAGYTLVGESWGARLRDPDRALLEAAVLRAAAAGLSVREVGPEYAQALCDLETTNAADYPYTPATAHTARDLAGTQNLWKGGRVFGALDGNRLVGATVIRALEDPTSREPIASDHAGQLPCSAVLRAG
jgi:hypothetical protein